MWIAVLTSIPNINMLGEYPVLGYGVLLYAAINEPKMLRWTGGRHVQPGRNEVVDELLRIADEELPLRR